MRERQEVIRDYIVAELQKRGLCIKDVAMKLEKSQGAVQQVVRSWTSTTIIRNELIRIINKKTFYKIKFRNKKTTQSRIFKCIYSNSLDLDKALNYELLLILANHRLTK